MSILYRALWQAHADSLFDIATASFDAGNNNSLDLTDSASLGRTVPQKRHAGDTRRRQATTDFAGGATRDNRIPLDSHNG